MSAIAPLLPQLPPIVLILSPPSTGTFSFSNNAVMDDKQDRPAKRPKLTSNSASDAPENTHSPNLASLHRSITPPPARPGRVPLSPHQNSEKKDTPTTNTNQPQLIPSPIQLTHIRDFSDSLKNNEDTVRLRDILGDPMIRECWQFNYLFDVDFLMSQFDEDVRDLVSVKVVHGSWKSESDNKIRIDVSISFILVLVSSIVGNCAIHLIEQE